MRKKILIILIGFAGILNAQNPQIVNNSFENWTDKVFKSLHDYRDSGDENYGKIIQSTDAVHGQYSVKLQTRERYGELETGFFVNFDGDNFSGGVPYSQHVDSVCGYYKAHLIAQDSALLVALFKNSGVVVGGNIYKFAADRNTNTWTRFCYPTNMPTIIAADTLMFGAASSNAISGVGMENGSWIQLDSITLKSGDQALPPITDFSFENWDSRTISFPNDFDTSLSFDITSNPLPVEKVTDATDGNYAVKLNTVYSQQHQDIIEGGITNGVMDDWPFSGGLFIGQSAVPDQVSWDYKVQLAGFNNYDPSISMIFRYNGADVGTFGRSYSNNVTAYQHEVVSVNLTVQPDTLQFVAFSGDYPGNSLWVDNVELHYPAGITENLNIHQLVAFPVPSNDWINLDITAIKPEKINIELYDLNGKSVWQQEYNLQAGDNEIQINTAYLPPGNYQFRLEGASGTLSKKFIKK